MPLYCQTLSVSLSAAKNTSTPLPPSPGGMLVHSKFKGPRISSQVPYYLGWKGLSGKQLRPKGSHPLSSFLPSLSPHHPPTLGTSLSCSKFWVNQRVSHLFVKTNAISIHISCQTYSSQNIPLLRHVPG